MARTTHAVSTDVVIDIRFDPHPFAVTVAEAELDRLERRTTEIEIDWSAAMLIGDTSTLKSLREEKDDWSSNYKAAQIALARAKQESAAAQLPKLQEPLAKLNSQLEAVEQDMKDAASRAEGIRHQIAIARAQVEEAISTAGTAERQLKRLTQRRGTIRSLKDLDDPVISGLIATQRTAGEIPVENLGWMTVTIPDKNGAHPIMQSVHLDADGDPLYPDTANGKLWTERKAYAAASKWLVAHGSCPCGITTGLSVAVPTTNGKIDRSHLRTVCNTCKPKPEPNGSTIVVAASAVGVA